LSLVFADAHTHSGTLEIQPGPARISFENKADAGRCRDLAA